MVHLASKLWIIFQPPFPPHHWDGLVAWYLPKSCYLRSCQSWFSHRFIGWGSWGPCHHWMTQWVFSVDEISISNLETMVILGKNYFTLFYFRFALRDTDIGRLWLIWLSTMVVQMICFFLPKHFWMFWITKWFACIQLSNNIPPAARSCATKFYWVMVLFCAYCDVAGTFRGIPNYFWQRIWFRNLLLLKVSRYGLQKRILEAVFSWLHFKAQPAGLETPGP